MIEKFYAAHIKNTLDASAINVMYSRAARQPIKQPESSEDGKSAKPDHSRARKKRRQDQTDQEIQP